MTSTTFDLLLATATLSCALVAGLLATFAVIVMPGLRVLDDRTFLRTFVAIDAVIQRSQPAFVVTWVGSIVSLLAATVVGLAVTDGLGQVLLVVASVVYVGGVQIPTMAVNVPLNNRLQAAGVDSVPGTTVSELRVGFEHRWNAWNRRRSVLAVLVVVLLLLTAHSS